MKDHETIIDEVLIDNCNLLFKEFLFAYTTTRLGYTAIDDLEDEVCVSAVVGLNISIEPIPIGELKGFKKGLPHFVLETFHSKLVQTWNDLIIDLFKLLLKHHFAGQRQFCELKKKQIKYDFNDASSIEDQLKEGLVSDFAFEKYKDRVKIINNSLNKEGKHEDSLITIHKHIQTRNAFHHKGGKIDDFFLKDLGIAKVPFLDNEGNEKEYSVEDKIELTVPEFDKFRRSLLIVGQCWRSCNV